MALKNDEKFKEALTCRFKIDIRNLMNFDSRLESVKHLSFNGLLSGFPTGVENMGEALQNLMGRA